MTFKNNPFSPILSAEGLTTLDGLQMAQIRTLDQIAYVPAVECGNGGRYASILKSFNIVLTKAGGTELEKKISTITDFRAGNYLGRPGSTPPHFALADGTIFSPSGVPRVEAVFARVTAQFGRAGTLESWKEQVAEPLTGNSLACFLVLLAFAPCVMDLASVGNVGFELVGKPATGKTTGLMLPASAIGGAVERSTSCLVSLNATANGLETIIPHYHSMLMILEEGQLFAASESASTRRQRWREFGHRLADGSSKLRAVYGLEGTVSAPSSTPLWFLLNSNEPLAEVLGGGDTDADKAVLQRIQTLPVNRKYGIFDRLPEGYKGGGPFADALQQAMRENYGTALRAFLAGLVEMRNKNEAALKRKIGEYLDEFAEKVGLDHNDGDASRAAKAFGLPYVAGRLARHFGVIPKVWDPLKITLACYRLNRAEVLNRQPFEARLKRYASRRDLLKLERGKLPALSKEDIQSHPGLLIEQEGETLLVMSWAAVKRAFPDWKKIEVNARKHMRFDGDGKHFPYLKVSRSAPRKRMPTFVIPE